MHDCPECTQEMVWCRVCKAYRCERAKEYNQRESSWTCKHEAWCAHDDGYAKKSRFTIISPNGNWQLVDDETGKSSRWGGGFHSELSLIDLINQLSFELDILKKKLVEDTE